MKTLLCANFFLSLVTDGISHLQQQLLFGWLSISRTIWIWTLNNTNTRVKLGFIFIIRKICRTKKSCVHYGIVHLTHMQEDSWSHILLGSIGFIIINQLPLALGIWDVSVRFLGLHPNFVHKASLLLTRVTVTKYKTVACWSLLSCHKICIEIVSILILILGLVVWSLNTAAPFIIVIMNPLLSDASSSQGKRS